MPAAMGAETTPPVFPPAQRTPVSSPVGPQEAEDAQRLLRRIGRNHPVRAAAEAWIAGSAVPPQTRDTLLRALKRPQPYHWRKQAIAAWMLGHAEWQGADTEDVEKRLMQVVNTWVPRDIIYRLLRANMLVAPISVCLIVSLIARENFNLFSLSLMLIGMVLLSAFLAFFVTPVLALVENAKITRIRIAAIVALGCLRSVEGLPTLARASMEGPQVGTFTSWWQLRRVRRAGLEAIGQILPCVTEYDYARLASSLPTLCRVLKKVAIRPRQEPQKAEALALGLLTALSKIGDGRAVNAVEQVAQNAASASVRSSAQGVLSVLQDRQRQENAANTLLRGASQAAPAQDTLLRAATATHETAPQQLLRPDVSPRPVETPLQETTLHLSHPQTYQPQAGESLPLEQQTLGQA